MSDTPTERFDAPTAPLTPEGDPPQSRRNLYILLAVAGAVLVALIILLILLLTRENPAEPSPAPSDTATASITPTPSETVNPPSPSPSANDTEVTPPPPPPPAPTGPIASFTVNKTNVDCSGGGVTAVPLHFSWKANGLGLWFGVGVNDAEAAPYGQYELTDELDIDYQCGQDSGQQKYTITVKSAEGDKTSQSITITE